VKNAKQGRWNALNSKFQPSILTSSEGSNRKDGRGRGEEQQNRCETRAAFSSGKMVKGQQRKVLEMGMDRSDGVVRRGGEVGTERRVPELLRRLVATNIEDCARSPLEVPYLKRPRPTCKNTTNSR